MGGLDGVNFYQFRNRYIKMGGFMGKQVLGLLEDKKAEYDAHIKDWWFMAKKVDWLDLPEKIYSIRQLELNPHQEVHYKEMLQNLSTEIDTSKITAANVITKMLKLQQISSGFAYDKDGKVMRIPGSVSKLDDLKNLIGMTTGKILVSVVFKATLDLLMEELKAFNPAVIAGNCLLYTSPSPRDRQKSRMPSSA